MSLKEKFNINPLFVNEEDIIPLYSEQFGDTYRFKQPIQIPGMPGFYLIPEFLDYGINLFGDVIKISDGNQLKTFVHDANPNERGTYLKYTLGYRTNYRHRLLMLTFSYYQQHPAEMVVNHKNGIKGDDFLLNLEWVTYRGNYEHALTTGLLHDNSIPKPVTVSNHLTNKTVECESIAAAQRLTGLHLNTLTQRLKNCNSINYPDGWRFKFNEEEWLPLKPRPFMRSSDRPLRALNLRNGEIIDYYSLPEASHATGCNINTIFSQVNTNVTQANNGYIFRYADAAEPFPTFTNLQLRLYQHSGFNGRQKPGALLLNGDGTEYGFGTLEEMWKLLGYKSNDGILKCIRLGIPAKGKMVIYVDPNGTAP